MFFPRFISYYVATLVVCATGWGIPKHPVCCVIQDGEKLFLSHYSCTNSAKTCCQKHALKDRRTRLLSAHDDLCRGDELTRYNSEVEVCYAPTLYKELAPPIVGGGLDLVMETLAVRHAWIRTVNKEAGQGPGRILPWWTHWSDHQGRGNDKDSICFPVAKSGTMMPMFG